MALAELPKQGELWRISNYTSLDGIGALRGGGRWNTAGHAVVYLAASPAGAMLEALVHLAADDIDMPDSYRLLKVVSSEAEVTNLPEPADGRWREKLTMTQSIGDKWIEEASTVLARVPSVIVPFTWNYLLNPAHPDAKKVKLETVTKHLYDPRLLRAR